MQSRNTLVMSHEATAAIGLDADYWVVTDPNVAVLNRCYDVLVVVEDAADLEAVLRTRDLLGALTFVGLFGYDDIVSQLAAIGQVPLVPTLGYVETNDHGRFFRSYAFKAQ